jgi:hypothetical protein
MILTHTKDFVKKWPSFPIFLQIKKIINHQISTNFVVEKMSFESFKNFGNNIINVKGGKVLW